MAKTETIKIGCREYYYVPICICNALKTLLDEYEDFDGKNIISEQFEEEEDE